MTQDAPVQLDDAPRAGATARFTGTRVKLLAGAVALVAASATVGWLAPQLVARYTKPSYLGQPASSVAKDLQCRDFAQATKHDESVYKYRDQGTCVLEGTTVTITTFDRVADGETFAAVMRAVIPILHPTWVGASYAAGDGWNVADARNLTASASELAVRRLGMGAVHVIPTGN